MISVALLPSLASLVGHRVLYSTADEGSLEVTSLNSTVSRELNSTTTANCNCGSILSVLSTRLFNNNYKRWFLTGLPLSLSWENARTFWVTWHLLPKAQYNPGNWGADGNYECPTYECVGISTRWRKPLHALRFPVRFNIRAPHFRFIFITWEFQWGFVLG